MKWLVKSLLPLLVLASCSAEEGSMSDMEPVAPQEEEILGHGEMVLGETLQNPYSMENIEASMDALGMTKASPNLSANCIYVRFLPEDAVQFETLASLGLDLLDHPLDRRIIKDGDYWHDPSLPEESITWQYTVVPPDFEFPEGIRHEVLDECYVPDSGAQTRTEDVIDWDAVECKAYELTGNSDMISPGTRSKVRPSGRITITDRSLSSGRKVGVSGVKVMANTFVKVSSAYTDANGSYSFSSGFSAKPHYRLCFENKKGFSIGLNLILVPASLSALGKGMPEGMDYNVEEDSDDALFRRCVVNNSAYDYYEMCQREGISVPASNLRFWILASMNPSCTMMMHHGAILDAKLVGNYLDLYKALVRVFAPDITIGTKNKKDNYAAIYSSTVHELAHASHFQKVGTDYWGKYARYVIESFLITGSCYGTGNSDNAGYCEVGEMWAFFMERSLYKQRYGVTMGYGSLWFSPEIFDLLVEEGITRADICSVLNRNVCDAASLKTALTSAYSSKKSAITKAFAQYGR
ncbi:MAG: hypothetical protein MJY84_04750 [Bacteroidales bacterium]|nr:hypothetical protein [Bacteroidales bacterium]